MKIYQKLLIIIIALYLIAFCCSCNREVTEMPKIKSKHTIEQIEQPKQEVEIKQQIEQPKIEVKAVKSCKKRHVNLRSQYASTSNTTICCMFCFDGTVNIQYIDVHEIPDPIAPNTIIDFTDLHFIKCDKNDNRKQYFEICPLSLNR